MFPAPESTHHTTGLLGRLNAEWSELVTTPASRTAVHAWRDREPGLAGLTDLAAIESAIRAGARAHAEARADADELLLALLRQAVSPDAPWTELAGRTVLQLMLPKAVAIARSQGGRVPDPDDRISAVVACLYETIRSYPVERRPHRVAGNLGLDTLHLFQRRTGTGAGPAASTAAAVELPTDPTDPLLDQPLAWPLDRPRSSEDPLAGLLSCLQRALDLHVIDATDEAVADQASDPAAAAGSGRERLLELLVWAVEQRVLAVADAALLAHAYSGARPVDDGTLAARLGCERSTVCKRRHRAIRALQRTATEFLAAESSAA